jgi:hypothetical protein
MGSYPTRWELRIADCGLRKGNREIRQIREIWNGGGSRFRSAFSHSSHISRFNSPSAISSLRLRGELRLPAFDVQQIATRERKECKRSMSECVPLCSLRSFAAKVFPSPRFDIPPSSDFGVASQRSMFRSLGLPPIWHSALRTCPVFSPNKKRRLHSEPPEPN